MMSIDDKKSEARKDQKAIILPITSFVLPTGIIGEMVHNPEQATTALLTFLDGNIELSSHIVANNIRYEPYSAHNPLLIHKVIRFSQEATLYDSWQSLIKEVRDFIHCYMELPKTMEDIAVYYVFLTWIYDTFNELPYLRIRGEFGSGKTRFLNVVGALCYKPIMASGASTVAPLFHILHQVGGTLVLDEADFRFSSETADITKILNNGNARGFPVLRCEKKDGKEFKPKAYTVFGPKLIASRNNYEDDALESRCITFDTNFIRTRSDVPLSLPDDFEEQATVLRNKLLSWRFHHYFKKRSNNVYEGLSPRFNQIYAPLLSLIDDNSMRHNILTFALTAQEQSRVDQGLKVEADVLKVIMMRCQQKQPLTIGAIAKDFAKLYVTQYERKVTPNWIGCIVRQKLRLATRKTHSCYMIAEGQSAILKRLYQQFDIEKGS